MARIRIAVAVDPDGLWEAAGSNDDPGLKAMEHAQCWLIERGGTSPLRTFWIEADVEPAVVDVRPAVAVSEDETVTF